MKQTIRKRVGDQLTCSVGVAPNAFLAKIGTELEKPDGLVILNASDLPDRLHELSLTDFTGINRRMAARLNAAGIFSSKDLCDAGPKELARAFGSVTGERWWYLLRGFEINLPENARKSLGHSHILPPELRSDEGCKEVLLRLIGKAAMRMRQEGLCTTAMDISVSSRKKGRGWSAGARFDATNDTVEFDERFIELWKDRDFNDPLGVGVTFHNLAPAEGVTPSLFAFRQDRSAFNDAVDSLNRKFGKNTIYLAGMEHAKNTADEKIAFGKTSLLSEGKGDNDEVNTQD
jgi:DNA polymerase-4